MYEGLRQELKNKGFSDADIERAISIRKESDLMDIAMNYGKNKENKISKNYTKLEPFYDPEVYEIGFFNCNSKCYN
jgi:SOS response regulatory protein OraA/RecX